MRSGKSLWIMKFADDGVIFSDSGEPGEVELGGVKSSESQ